MFSINWMRTRHLALALALAMLLWIEPGSLSASASGLPPLPAEGQNGPEGQRPPWREHRPDLADVWLPDLETLPPFDLRLIVRSWNGVKKLRFSNGIWNRGPGPLEVRGQYDTKSNSMVVTQVLYGIEPDQVNRRVGRFEFEREHQHWHWEGFSRYQVWSLTPTGELDKIVANSSKVGYCMLDLSPLEAEAGVENLLPPWLTPARGRYNQCHWRVQGISVGWQDSYRYDLPGQEIDVTHLPDGPYTLLSTVNPDGLIFEGNAENNTARQDFWIRGDELVVGSAGS